MAARRSAFIRLCLFIATVFLVVEPAVAQSPRAQPGMRGTTQLVRKAAAKNRAAAGLTATAAAALAAPLPGATPDYFGPWSNYANSPLPSGTVTITVTNGGTGYTAPTCTVSDVYLAAPVAATCGFTPSGPITSVTVAGTFTAPVVTITDPTGTGAIATATVTPTVGGMLKFLDAVPSLVIATPDTVTYPGSDYYEIELVEDATWTFHASLAATKMRGYRQTNLGTAAGCTPPTPTTPSPPPAGTCTSTDNTVAPPATFSYLGPTILAQRDRPTRIKFTNNLPAGSPGGDLFIPVDTTVMGAGAGYDLKTNTTGVYPQNRGTLHLHGGFTPWISDGTPHQWVTPTNEPGPLTTGVSTQPVPDMPIPPGNSMTFYWPNQQSGRLMFFHDHAYGITRLNVYAGEAAGYLLVDPVERKLTDGTTPGIPAMPDIPLVIQDRTFVWGDQASGTGTWATDPTWNWGVASGLWFPHVYMPNQNPWDMTGANAMGRWDYALWFWPPFTGLLQNGTLPNPYYDPINAPWEPPEIPGTPNPSLVPEAFMDTPVVNGKAYPTLAVPAGPVRFRILNAANDRFWNLSMFVAADKTSPTTATGGPGTVLCTGAAAVANCTEVKMVPFNTSQNLVTPFPNWWYTPGLNFTFDDRSGGVPDPTTRGPAMIQIGTEGGLLPAPAVIRNQPVNYTYNRRDIVVLNVQEKALFLGPAERADVIVDFTPFAGQTLILYNDSPAPVPAADLRIDYFTGGADQTDTGGAPPTLPGYGPNTRTVMQIVVGGTPSGTQGPVDYVNPAVLSGLQAALPVAFASSQDPIVVPQVAYSAAYPGQTPATDVVGASLSSISATSLTFTPLGAASPLTINMGSKAIQELFELDYGRMNATLGVELPFTNGGNQTTIPFGYLDPPTELIYSSAAITAPIAGDGTQIWKITHNGVDTHAIHVHLFNVQVINRVGWDGAIRPPDANELGWKETVRMNPLEDIIVALRPTTPKLPFGIPDSIRLLDVTSAPGTTGQFSGIDPNNNPVTVTNQLYNYGWEYVWHCHLLGHEENDMMRPTVFNAPRLLPPAPTGVTYARPGGATTGPVTLTWIDPTPPAISLGNAANEIGFKIERATVGKNGKPGAYSVLPATPAQPWPLANQTTYTDATAATGTSYSYRVVAYNVAGTGTSSAVPGAPAGTLQPADPSGMAAILVSGPQVKMTWIDNSTNETGFAIERSVNAGPYSALATVGTNVTSYTTTGGVIAGNTYTYRVKAVNAAGSSGYSTSGPVPVLVPAAPTGLIADPVQVGKKTDAVTIRWTDNATTETAYTVARCTGTAAACGLATAVWTNLTTTLAANSIAYNDTGLTKGATYSYRVAATNLAGPSAWSNVIAVLMP